MSRLFDELSPDAKLRIEEIIEESNMSLDSYNEGRVTGVIETLKFQDKLTKKEVIKVLNNMDFNDDDIEYWLDWLSGWFE